MQVSSCSALYVIAVIVVGMNTTSAEHDPDKGRMGQGPAQDLEVLPEVPHPVTTCDIDQTDQ